MERLVRPLAAAAAAALLGAALTAAPAAAGAPKYGGIWKVLHRDSPPSASIHDEARVRAEGGVTRYRDDEKSGRDANSRAGERRTRRGEAVAAG